jgi:8-oxo-dGTP pyrophosphatase MutT (NUDIX family)
MKPRPPRRPRVAVGIIEQHDNHVLIVLPSTPDDQTRLWQFPRGLAGIDESPEQAMRRTAIEQLGIHVEIVVGQPPVTAMLDGQEVEMRFFFCGVADGEPRPLRKSAGSQGHLRSDFDDPSKPVVKWLLESYLTHPAPGASPPEAAPSLRRGDTSIGPHRVINYRYRRRPG